MVGQCLLDRLGYFCLDASVIRTDNRIVSYELIEEYCVKDGSHEKWRVRIARDLETGTSYWCYLGRVA